MTLVEYLLWEFQNERKEKDMKSLLKNLLLQILQEFAQRAFTMENLKIVRDRLLSALKEQVKSTETTIDDWAYSITERALADDNLQKIFDWVVRYAEAFMNPAVCKASPEMTLEALAKEIDFTTDTSCEVCAAPSLVKIIQMLEIIVPILYDWYKGMKEEK